MFPLKTKNAKKVCWQLGFCGFMVRWNHVPGPFSLAFISFQGKAFLKSQRKVEIKQILWPLWPRPPAIRSFPTKYQSQYSSRQDHVHERGLFNMGFFIGFLAHGNTGTVLSATIYHWALLSVPWEGANRNSPMGAKKEALLDDCLLAKGKNHIKAGDLVPQGNSLRPHLPRVAGPGPRPLTLRIFPGACYKSLVLVLLLNRVAKSPTI